jgi:hypothetical protein
MYDTTKHWVPHLCEECKHPAQLIMLSVVSHSSVHAHGQEIVSERVYRAQVG